MKMKRVVFFSAVVVMMAFLVLAPAHSQKESPQLGCGQNCIKLTQRDFNDKIEKHKMWLETNGKQGEKAIFAGVDFKGVKLSKARLRGANFLNCDFREVKIYSADLRKASFYRSDLRKADIADTDLRRAIFTDTDLRKASFDSVYLNHAFFTKTDSRKLYFDDVDLRGAYFTKDDLRAAIFKSSDLRGARFFSPESMQAAEMVGVKLEGAQFLNVDFKRVSFEPEPGQLPQANYLFNAKSLSKMTYENSPHGLIALRNEFKKYGMRQQEREMTFAIKHNERIRSKTKFWNYIQYVFFEFPVGWGLYPECALLIMACLIPFFTVFYYFPLGLGAWLGGTIWMRWREGRAANLGESGQPRPLKRMGWRRVAFAFYFSLLSAFHIGWRELNVGNWITRMQPREYTLQATGWPRVISGVQSLISVYLLALAVLSYFGRPFE